MIDKQIDIFGNTVSKKVKPKTDNQKRNWENRFQRWSSNNLAMDSTHHYGKCGYGSMCDFCVDMSYGRPCVRALNEMCRTEGVVIDYSKDNFMEVWDGDF